MPARPSTTGRSKASPKPASHKPRKPSGAGSTAAPSPTVPAEASEATRVADLAGRHRKLQVVESPGLMQAASMALRQRGATVAFVPTMGALHQGHVDLMRHARTLADVVVASVFVNPTQFGPGEDFDRYPRNRDADLMKCADAGVDLAFFPQARDMYPDGFQTTVNLGPITQVACGRYRPGHFAGVATVVSKLLNIVQPTFAVFGEKDWQQLAVIRRMVKDLNLPVDIIGSPTVREKDGLAMSSRNARLTPRDREQAPVLHRALVRAQEAWAAGTTDAAALNRVVLDEVKKGRGVKLQYVEVLDADLNAVKVVDRPCRILVAAFLGDVRLIDNVPVGPGQA